jgi:hypothetical protein
MFRSISLVLAAVALVAAPTASAKAKTYKTQGSVLAGIAGTVDGDIVVTGLVDDSVFGDGAAVFNKVSAGKGIVTPFTAYFANGSISGVATLDAIVQEDHSIVYENARLAVKRGTGMFKGAKGKGTFTGGASPNSTQFVIDYKLKYRVP